MVKEKKPSQYLASLQEAVRACEAIRRDTKSPEDVTLGEYINDRWQLSMDGLYDDLGLNPASDTIQNIINLPDPAMRWLIPEIFRDALRLGLRKNPIYPNIIAGEQTVAQTSVTMPAINMSEATPAKVGVAETIPLGDVSFDQKTVKIYKLGRGVKIPYEVAQYVALNVVSIFLQDFGVKLAMGLDALAITTLINGDQAGGTDAAAVVGITTANTLVFRDLLRIWVRMARLGKVPNIMIGGETAAMDILDLLTTNKYFGTPRATVDINMKSPMPQNSDFYVHGSVATSKVIILDPTSTMIKLNAQPLLVETDKIIQNQTQETYATLTTGFATLFRDSRIIMDETLAFSGNGFPTYMDPSAAENVVFK